MSEINDIIKNGQLMPADVTAQIRDKCYHVDVDPFTKIKRLFFDNSSGSFRLKDASEAFRNVDDLPNCGGHGGAASDYLDSLRVQACKDISTMFNAEGGCIATSMTASIIVFDVSEAIIANVPGTNVVTTEFSDWATNCPEYKVTAVQVLPSNGPTDWQESYASWSEKSRRIAVEPAE